VHAPFIIASVVPAGSTIAATISNSLATSRRSQSASDVSSFK
jgi:hypothetical protein